MAIRKNAVVYWSACVLAGVRFIFFILHKMTLILMISSYGRFMLCLCVSDSSLIISNNRVFIIFFPLVDDT